MISSLPRRKNASIIWCLFAFILSGCSSSEAQKKSPTDRVIEGPFVFTTEWTEIKFDPPLEIAPHFQEINLMLGDQYQPDEVQQDEIYNFPYGYKDKNTGEIVRPEVILFTDKGEEYTTKVTSGGGGWKKIDQGVFSQIGYGPEGDPEQYLYPKGTKIVSAKIRSNVKINVEHLYWNAWDYWKAPDRSWDDVKPNEFVLPKNRGY